MGDLRALERILLEGVSDFVGRGPLLELLDKLVVDTFLHVDSASRTAALAVIEEDAEVDPRDGVVDVSVVKDDIGALATQLERDLFQVRASSSFHDLTADDGAASEGDLVDVHMGRECGAGDLAKAGNDVDDAWWETGFLDEFADVEGTERCLLSGLDDNGITTGDGWADFP